MVIVVVVKVRLVEVGGMVVVVRLAEGSGVTVVVVQVVMVENGAASAMRARRPKKMAKRPRIEVRSFMVGESCSDAGTGFKYENARMEDMSEAVCYQEESVWMEDGLDFVSS